MPGRFRVVVEAAAEPGTSGQTRVIVDGTPVGDEQEVAARYVVDVSIEGELDEIVVQARRTDGEGAVRVTATLLPL